MDNPFHTTGLRHGTGDPRGLRERIEAQLTERIDEAVEMAALHLLVELRKRHGRPAPESDNRDDRDEFNALAAHLLAYLGEAFAAELDTDQRRGLDQATAGNFDARERGLRGQVYLSRQLPDYWQRFETHRAAHAEARFSTPTRPDGLFRRLFR
ncbi:MAG TPA: hypothetical protein VMT97_07495 [Terriglobales bacterium]|nr:hypothetical protein [Terriglobales bacterium]